MERPIFKPVGTPVEELDTPALVVDLNILEKNIGLLSAYLQRSGPAAAKLRPHVESHRCPAIARKQLVAAGTVGGICVSTVGQAEVFAEHGFTDMLVANEIIPAQKIRRLCTLARQASITVAVDQVQNVQDLSDAAGLHGVAVQVVVDIHTSGNGCGVEPGQPALDLARMVQQAPHLEFAGLMSREGPIEGIQQVLDTRDLLEQAGLAVRMVCVGASYDYEVACHLTGVTEVLAETYALMDARYQQSRPQLTPAASVMATVTSRPEPGTAIVDAGQKAVGIDTGLPLVRDLPGVTAVALSAEHGRLQLSEAVESRVALGDKVWLTPWDIGTCANLYDYMHAVRDGRLEAVWAVAARGRYR
jgi:D-serine deaminase-like pyridoxal phosphate-dependent protein